MKCSALIICTLLIAPFAYAQVPREVPLSHTTGHVHDGRNSLNVWTTGAQLMYQRPFRVISEQVELNPNGKELTLKVLADLSLPVGAVWEVPDGEKEKSAAAYPFESAKVVVQLPDPRGGATRDVELLALGKAAPDDHLVIARSVDAAAEPELFAYLSTAKAKGISPVIEFQADYTFAETTGGDVYVHVYQSAMSDAWEKVFGARAPGESPFPDTALVNREAQEKLRAELKTSITGHFDASAPADIKALAMKAAEEFINNEFNADIAGKWTDNTDKISTVAFIYTPKFAASELKPDVYKKVVNELTQWQKTQAESTAFIKRFEKQIQMSGTVEDYYKKVREILKGEVSASYGFGLFGGSVDLSKDYENLETSHRERVDKSFSEIDDIQNYFTKNIREMYSDFKGDDRTEGTVPKNLQLMRVQLGELQGSFAVSLGEKKFVGLVKRRYDVVSQAPVIDAETWKGIVELESRITRLERALGKNFVEKFKP